MATFQSTVHISIALCLIFLGVVSPYRNARLPEVTVSDDDIYNFIKWMRDHDDNRAHSGSGTAPRNTGRAEVGNRAERMEEDRFVDAVMQTEIGRETYLFLHRHKHPYARTEQVYREKLRQLWFNFYSRARGQPDTSGFEHVFVGEVTGNEVQGLHSWVRFYLLERDRNEKFDYKGYLIRRFSTLGAVKFSWQDEWKRSSSFFIGTSPEFDFSLYTLCFLTRFEKDNQHRSCKFSLDNCPFKIISHPLYQRGVVHVGSAYPHADGRTCHRNSNTGGGRRGHRNRGGNN